MATYDDSNADEKTARRYTAALKAIDLGKRDAYIDWGLTYLICYAIVGGITWYNADPNIVLVIWGFSLMCSAVILGIAGLKIPAWLGYYRKSQLKTLRDTSGFAAIAVEEWLKEDSTVALFRHEVRLGVGKHFSQFVWFCLPFYVALKFWWFLLSVAYGLILGHLFLYVVFKCRKRFSHHRGRVCMGASFFIAVCSSTCFMFGVWIIDSTWGIDIGKDHIILPVAFFVWLALCGLFQAIKYYEHLSYSKGDTEEIQCQLFEETVHEKEQEKHSDADVEGRVVEDADTVEVAPNEDVKSAATPSSNDRRELMHKDTMNATGHGYFYQTGKRDDLCSFDRVEITCSLGSHKIQRSLL
jgi:hypothetical protein